MNFKLNIAAPPYVPTSYRNNTPTASQNNTPTSYQNNTPISYVEIAKKTLEACSTPKSDQFFDAVQQIPLPVKPVVATKKMEKTFSKAVLVGIDTTPPIQQKTGMTTTELVNEIACENGIFGAYCLSDVVSFSRIVQMNNCDLDTVTFDCFNLETIKDIEDSAKGTNLEHYEIYKKNHDYLKENGVKFKIHYLDKPNDLLIKKEDKVSPKLNWDKYSYSFAKNMIFLNPYCQDAEGTKKLITAFFNYAETNLKKEGIVTLMWNPSRIDDLHCIKVTEIAKKSGFQEITVIRGKTFAMRSGFTHLKNSTSLNSAIEKSKKNEQATAIISAHRTDELMLFKKRNESRKVSETNEIAMGIFGLKKKKIRKA